MRLVLAILLAISVASAGSAGLAQELSSGGIGLSRDQWEAVHGPGVPGQSLISYANGTYEVGFQDGRIRFLEVGWEGIGGITMASAQQHVAALLPSDWRVVEVFVYPPTAAGPIGLFGVRYDCPSLRGLPGTGSAAWTGSVQVLFQTSGLLEPTVMRASITVGEVAQGQ